MIEHIVLIRWMETTSEETIDKALVELRQMKDKIPGIIDLTCGANFSARAKRYKHGLVARFKDRAALEAYLAHPEHQRVVQHFIGPFHNDILILDYEF